jgi:hypothetical protein
MNDVIVQVKEAFLDENIDVDVLYQLKKVCCWALGHLLPLRTIFTGHSTFFSQKVMFYKVVCRDLNSNFVEHYFS